ncbi:hypothetical protein GCM10028857_20190 [Salinarchaeum chitinilyticum]
MTLDGPDADAMSLAAWPSPICYVEAADAAGSDGAVVRAANASFESTFGSDPTGDSVAQALTAVGINADALPDVNGLVAGDEHRPARVSTRGVRDAPVDTYLVQGFPADAKPGRYLAFTPLPADEPSEQPSGERPSGEQQSGERPSGEQPSGERPSGEQQSGERPSGEQPSGDRPSREVELETVASAISHDLRNPLDVATARLEAARESDDLQAAEEHLEHVSRAHDRMERLIDDVLTLAGTAGAVDPSEEVDLGAVAEAAWSTVDTDDASLVGPADCPPIVADEGRLRRLLENLFRNAVEHGSTSPRSPVPHEDAVEHGAERGDSDRSASGSDDGSDGLTVTVRRLDDDAPEGFAVADDGVGIPIDRTESVFEPGVSSEDHGTGLGLAIVERIVARHGWSIAVADCGDGGARFEITGVSFASNR